MLTVFATACAGSGINGGAWIGVTVPVQPGNATQRSIRAILSSDVRLATVATDLGDMAELVDLELWVEAGAPTK